MRYLLLVLFFALLIPVASAAGVNVTILNSAPVLDAEYIVTQPTPPTLLYIDDFSHDPNDDNYTCSYTFFDGMNIFGDMCIIYHDFTNMTYSITVTLNDSMNVSIGVIDIIINTSARPEANPGSSGGGNKGSADDVIFLSNETDGSRADRDSLTGDVTEGEDVVLPEEGDLETPSESMHSLPPIEETPKQFFARPFFKISSTSLLFLAILLVFFVLRKKNKEHEEVTDEFSDYLDFVSHIGKK